MSLLFNFSAYSFVLVVHEFFFLCLAERSQDSEVVLLSDSNSTQDAFTDPTSSQDSSHKPVSVKAGSSSSESTTPVKDTQPTHDEAGIQGSENSRLNLEATLFEN